MAEVHLGIGRSGGRATRNIIRDVARLLLPTAATERGTISNSRNRDPRLFLWPIDANTWIVLTPDSDKYAESLSDYSKMRVPPIGEVETPENGFVEFSRGWTLHELSGLVRE